MLTKISLFVVIAVLTTACKERSQELPGGATDANSDAAVVLPEMRAAALPADFGTYFAIADHALSDELAIARLRSCSASTGRYEVVEVLRGSRFETGTMISEPGDCTDMPGLVSVYLATLEVEPSVGRKIERSENFDELALLRAQTALLRSDDPEFKNRIFRDWLTSGKPQLVRDALRMMYGPNDCTLAPELVALLDENGEIYYDAAIVLGGCMKFSPQFYRLVLPAMAKAARTRGPGEKEAAMLKLERWARREGFESEKWPWRPVNPCVGECVYQWWEREQDRVFGELEDFLAMMRERDYVPLGYQPDASPN